MKSIKKVTFTNNKTIRVGDIDFEGGVVIEITSYDNEYFEVVGVNGDEGYSYFYSIEGELVEEEDLIEQDII
jgi:hypothetical protein